MHLVSEMLAHDYNISHSTIQVEVEYCGGHEHAEHQDHHDHDECDEPH